MCTCCGGALLAIDGLIVGLILVYALWMAVFMCGWLSHSSLWVVVLWVRGCGGVRIVAGDVWAVVRFIMGSCGVLVGGHWYTLHGDECESVKQGSSASGNTLKHLTLTYTHYTHYHNLGARVRGLWYWKISLVSEVWIISFYNGFYVFNRKCSPKTLQMIGYSGCDV